MTKPEHEELATIAGRIFPGGRVERVWSLEGGVSAAMHGIEVRLDAGALQRIVVRRPGGKEWKTVETGLARREADLLKFLQTLGLPVPKVHLLDETHELLPSPFFVMELIEGSSRLETDEVAPAIQQMAEFLTELHALDVSAHDLPALPQREDPVAGAFEYLTDRQMKEPLRAALEGCGDLHETARSALCHGDFWPENVLFSEGRISAVLDWEDAAIGDPISDLACARVELFCAYDQPEVEAFTQRYARRHSVDPRRLAVWEIYASAAALASMDDWGLEPEALARRRERTDRFLAAASASLLAVG